MTVTTAPARIRMLSVVGTRPEAIKIAPVALEAARRPTLTHRLLATGQHGALFDDALASFGLATDASLPPEPGNGDPDTMVAFLADALTPAIAAEMPDIVLVQGDTNSAYGAAIAADRIGIMVGHVEAGLRSHDFAHPWPEERNRVMIDRIATLLFAPTPEAARNLAEDGEAFGHTIVTGNTGIDALLAMRTRLGDPAPGPGDAALILLTCHRRENIGAGVEGICAAALRLAARGDVRLLCPVHPNPAVGGIVRRRLGCVPGIALVDPLPYAETVAAMAASRLILTDSGGVQEEASTLGIPTLVLREVTERPEGLASGNLRLVGTDPDRILAAAARLLDDPHAHAAMARRTFPFGRGGTATKICDVIEQYFSAKLPNERELRSRALWITDGARQGA